MSLMDYRRARDAFDEGPSLHRAEDLMRFATILWIGGSLGDATYVREALEPVRSYLLAGNTPLPEGHGQSAKIIVPETKAPFLASPPGEEALAERLQEALKRIDAYADSNTVEASRREGGSQEGFFDGRASAFEVAARLLRAALREAEQDDEARFWTADWYWKADDPESSADNPRDLLEDAYGVYDAIELGSAFQGPSRWFVFLPKLEDEDERECLTFATRLDVDRAIEERRAALLKMQRVGREALQKGS